MNTFPACGDRGRSFSVDDIEVTVTANVVDGISAPAVIQENKDKLQTFASTREKLMFVITHDVYIKVLRSATDVQVLK